MFAWVMLNNFNKIFDEVRGAKRRCSRSYSESLKQGDRKKIFKLTAIIDANIY